MSAPARAISVLAEQNREMQKDDPSIQVADLKSDLADILADDDIARLAYALWQHRGCPNGSAENDWFEAERTLREPVGVES